jgi:hypothetical protein
MVTERPLYGVPTTFRFTNSENLFQDCKSATENLLRKDGVEDVE